MWNPLNWLRSIEFAPPVGFWWFLGALALVAAGIILLYFLKLKRVPLEVPSTFLWYRAIEDLHVNSLWQRLRSSLLLILQLLFILILALALLNVLFSGRKLEGERFIFLIDNSASMAATDVAASRLEESKRQVRELIENMESGQQAMILTYSNEYHVVQSYTDNQRQLLRKLDAIQPSSRTTVLAPALLAASGRANPGRISDPDNQQDIQVADAVPATVYIYSDGKYQDAQRVEEFPLGNLSALYVAVGKRRPDNVAITAFSAERNLEKPDQLQAFAELRNYTDRPLTVDLSLYYDKGETAAGRMFPPGASAIDAKRVALPAGGTGGVEFDLYDPQGQMIDEGALKLELERKDDLSLDNVAFAALNPPRQARILLVTSGNKALSLALETEEAVKLAAVTEKSPAYLSDAKFKEQAAEGFYDLVIFDRCLPETMPLANTWFIGNAPPVLGWKAGEKQGPPIIIDHDAAYPLMALIELGNVQIVEAIPLTGPQGTADLIYSDIGTILAVGPREGYLDLVMGFDIFSTGEGGGLEVNTNWPIRRSFPIFVMNVIKFLGGSRTAVSTPSTPPGEAIVHASSTPVEEVTFIGPGGRPQKTRREEQNQFRFIDTEQPGIYTVREGSSTKAARHYAVNLFDARESDIVPREKMEIGYTDYEAAEAWTPYRWELWKYVVILALAVVIFEWIIFNRRVHL